MRAMTMREKVAFRVVERYLVEHLKDQERQVEETKERIIHAVMQWGAVERARGGQG